MITKDMTLADVVKAHPNTDRVPFLEYPRHLHKADGTHVTVTSDDDKAVKLAEGWHLTPAAARAAEQADSKRGRKAEA